MPFEGERAQVGWNALAECLGCSISKARRLKGELEEAGVIFRMNLGRPPRRRVCFWQSELVRWTRLKGHKREPV